MLDFIHGDENDLINHPAYKPATAFVIVESVKGFMLLYNKFYQRWEITGGYIENAESPREAVVRECREESNQLLTNLKFLGIAHYADMNAAIYYSFLENEDPFIENDEISGMCWWKPGDEMDGIIEADSRKFIGDISSFMNA